MMKSLGCFGKSSVVRKLIHCVSLTLLAISLFSFTLPTPVAAQGIAISGSFYRHHFKLVPGESTRTPDIYVVVFNREDREISVQLTPHAPSGVNIYLAESNFVIPANKEYKVEVGVEVSHEAVPGEYMLTITAEVQQDGEGIVVIGAAQQQAKLTIMGEVGTINVVLVDCLGKPFPAEIRVCRKEEAALHPCAFSVTGELETRLVPGDYVAHAFLKGIEIAREEFTLHADETKQITLEGNTVFIYGFSAVPNYYEDTSEIAFANVVYTIENIYLPITSIRAILDVTLDGESLEQDEIISLPTLDVGRLSGSYKYTPTQRWENGTYIFKMKLYTEGKLCAQSPEQVLEVRKAPASPATGTNWMIFGLIAGGILLLIVIVVLVAGRRRRAKG